MSLEVLTEAIKKKSKISFEYNKSGKPSGKRFGDPHAVFIFRKIDGTESTKVHIVQTAGVTDTPEKIPEFRMFDLTELSSVQILSPTQAFDASPKYNPLSEMYKFVIAKI